jgi:hypothetical protein
MTQMIKVSIKIKDDKYLGIEEVSRNDAMLPRQKKSVCFEESREKSKTFSLGKKSLASLTVGRNALKS